MIREALIDSVRIQRDQTKGVAEQGLARDILLCHPKRRHFSKGSTGMVRPGEVDNPNMLNPSDQGNRPVTPCQSCQKASMTAVVLAGAFVYLRCTACGFVFAVQDRRSFVRPDHQRRMFSW
jgi:hypothetical protein